MPAPRGSKATAAQRKALFIETYLANGENGRHAYMTVYPHSQSPDAAKVAAWRLLQRPEVKRAIDKRRAEVRAKYRLNTENVMHELARVTRFNPKNLLDDEGNRIPLHLLDDDTAAALASVEIIETEKKGKTLTKVGKVRAHNKMAALAQAIKVLHLEERPVEVQEDEGEYDPRETVKILMFLAEETLRRKLPAPKKKVTSAG